MVKKILDNPVYMGKIAYGRRTNVAKEGGTVNAIKQKDESKIIIVDGIHEAIVSEMDWNVAHIKRQETGVRKEKVEADHYYALSGLIMCPDCGKRMYGIPSRKKKKDGTMYPTSYAYKCRQSGIVGGVPCSFHRQINCKEIDEGVFLTIATCFITPELVEKVNEKLNQNFDFESIETKIKELNQQKKKLEMAQAKFEQEQQLLDAFDEHYDRKFDTLSRQLDSVYDKLDELEISIAKENNKLLGLKSAKKTKQDAIDYLMGNSLELLRASDKEKMLRCHEMIDYIEIFDSKRDSGWLKTIHFKVPVNNNTEITDTINVWDLDKDLNEEGNFSDSNEDTSRR